MGCLFERGGTFVRGSRSEATKLVQRLMPECGSEVSPSTDLSGWRLRHTQAVAHARSESQHRVRLVGAEWSGGRVGLVCFCAKAILDEQRFRVIAFGTPPALTILCMVIVLGYFFYPATRARTFRVAHESNQCSVVQAQARLLVCMMCFRARHAHLCSGCSSNVF